MDKRARMVAVLYGAIWLLAVAGIIHGFNHAGLPLWSAFVVIYLLFFFINGSMAYVARSRRARAAGRLPPGYWRYMLFEIALPDFKAETSSYIRVLAGMAAVVSGLLLTGAGVGIGLDQARHGDALDAPALFAVVFLMACGLASLYMGWRAFTRKDGRRDDADR